MELPSTITLGSSSVHSVFQPHAQIRAGVMAEAPGQTEGMGQLHWDPITTSSVVHQQKLIRCLLKHFFPLFNQLCVK